MNSQPIHCTFGKSSLGTVLLGATPHGVCALFLGDDQEALGAELQKRFPRTRLHLNDQPGESLRGQLARVMELIENPGRETNLPLDIQGTPFQQRVWNVLRQIPAGETLTYAQVAQRLGEPKAVRAVAGACGANRIAVVIPCHRVIRSDGGLSGYRWGVERKRALLTREAL